MRLEASGLEKRLGGRRALDRVSLALGDGETLAVLGENGAGKSTLLRVLAGVLAPDRGAVLLDGRPITGARAEIALRRHVSYVPEAADPLPHLTVRELLALVGALRRAPPPAAGLVERLGVGPLLDQRLGTLSLGQRRRACLLMALVGDPWLLLLDEPGNGLDADGVSLLAALLAERAARGAAAVLATHDLAFVDTLSARRLRLRAGRLDPGAP